MPILSSKFLINISISSSIWRHYTPEMKNLKIKDFLCQSTNDTHAMNGYKYNTVYAQIFVDWNIFVDWYFLFESSSHAKLLCNHESITSHPIERRGRRNGVSHNSDNNWEHITRLQFEASSHVFTK